MGVSSYIYIALVALVLLKNTYIAPSVVLL